MATADNTYTVPANSAYAATGYIVEFETDALLLRSKVDLPADKDDQYYLCRRGENIRLIAHRYYKQYDSRASRLWWLIADANDIKNPADLDEWTGKYLRIPNYQKAKLRI